MDTGVHADLYTAGSAVYADLKSLVLLGEVPIGTRLREGRIAERLGVSRTPVREALLRLFAERFLERHPEGGFRVAPPSVETLRQLYDVRRALELFALRRSFESATTQALSAAGALHGEWADIALDPPRPDPEFVLLDEDFHTRLAGVSGNEELVLDLQRVNERIRPVRSHDFLTPGRIVATIQEHLGILGAVLAGDALPAQALLDSHISESQGVVEAAVVRALDKMLGAGRQGSPW